MEKIKRKIVQETERLGEGEEEGVGEQGASPPADGLNDDVSGRHEEGPAQAEDENNQQENHN